MKLKSRRFVLAVCGLAIVLLVLPYLIWHPRRLNHKGFDQIQIGMTQQEVESLLGGPPGIYYPSYYGAGMVMTAEGFAIPGAAEEALWYDDEVRFEVWFGDQGTVVGKHQRDGWYTSAYTCRHTALIWNAREPISLEPRRYETDPSRILRGQP